MRVTKCLSSRNLIAVVAAGAIAVSVAACGSTATAAKTPMTDQEIKDFLLQSDSAAMVADNAGYLAVVSAAQAQRDAVTKARGQQVSSTDISQVKADGEVTLSGLRARITALTGRTQADEDTRIQAAVTKATDALKGSDKKAITDALADLETVVAEVEAAVSLRENPPAETPQDRQTTVEEPAAPVDNGTGAGTTEQGGAGTGGTTGGDAGAGGGTPTDDGNQQTPGQLNPQPAQPEQPPAQPDQPPAEQPPAQPEQPPAQPGQPPAEQPPAQPDQPPAEPNQPGQPLQPAQP